MSIQVDIEFLSRERTQITVSLERTFAPGQDQLGWLLAALAGANEADPLTEESASVHGVQ